MSHHEPTIAGILRLLAAEYNEPVDERQILERVLQQRPSSAKNPYATIRERLRWDGLTLGWLRLNRHELVPLRIALAGLRFRCIPRARDVEAGQLPLVSLQPFAGLRNHDPRLLDSNANPLRLFDLAGNQPGAPGWHLPGFDLCDWYVQSGFAAGDSLLVTVLSGEPLTLQLQHEPAAEFRREQVAAQDAELLAAIVDQAARSHATLIPCDHLILPIFARAAWRTGYPGTPWQHLVNSSNSLQLIDDIFVTRRRSTAWPLTPSGDVFVRDEAPAAQSALYDLRSEIDRLQHEIHQARQQDAEAGIWSGQIQRSSAALNLFDRYNDDQPHARLLDEIEDLAADMELAEPADWDLDDFDDDLTEHLPQLDARERPLSYQEAHDRLIALLPGETIDRLQEASPEEAEVILAAHLNSLLVRDPALFPRIDLSPLAGDHAERYFTPEGGDRIWQSDDEWEEDDDWGDELTGDFEQRFAAASAVAAHSSDLMNQFHDYLRETGKGTATARQRTQQLAVYADFLASYYGRTLVEGDYATLDECLFFYYPRRVMNASPRQVREICIALKQFYAFLKLRGDIVDDRFAQAHWRRRDQAARVIELFDQINDESPLAQVLFMRLFEPYSK